jgi:sugar phosphate isomerase/epimerase
MRLGVLPPFFNAADADGLDALVPTLDRHRLSAICGPENLDTWDADRAAGYGEKARGLGLVIGEAGMWDNLMHPDADQQRAAVDRLRLMLQRASVMGCRNVVSLVGSRDAEGGPMIPHPGNFTEEFQREFRDVVLRVLDGLDLGGTRYLVETWPNTFFYEPEAMRAFGESIDHPAFGLHLDPCNLHHHQWAFRSTERLRHAFDILAPLCHSVHLKDIKWDGSHYQWLMHLDEVKIGEGSMDYPTLLRLIDETMPKDMTCYLEHLTSEADYIDNINAVHRHAEAAGVTVLPRGAV